MGVESSILTASSLAANPPKTTEWTAPILCAGEHGDRRLGHHRHVDHHPVAAAHAPRREGAGELRHAVAEPGIGEALLRAGDGAVVDQRRPVAVPRRDMPVERVVAGVQHPAREPAGRRLRVLVDHAVPATVPVDRLGGFRPETVRVVQGTAVDFVVALAHDISSSMGMAAKKPGTGPKRPEPRI